MRAYTFLKYDDLWKTLINKGIKKTMQTGIRSSTLAKMNRNEPVSISIILKICETFDCWIEEVVTVSKKAE